MNRRIIWADDSESFRESMIAQLEMICEELDVQAVIEGVSDGTELVSKVKAEKYDLVFTDNIMREVHGLRAIISIRQVNASIPVYMVSSSEVGQRALQFGATGYIDKSSDDFPRRYLEDAVKKNLF